MPRPRRARWWVLLAIPVLVVGYLGITFVQVRSAAGRDDRTPVDAIVVLGAAQYDGRPSPVLKRRLDHALELYRADVAPEIVLTGGKRDGDRFTEAFTGFKYLRQAGVPDDALVIISDGANTWESLAAAARQLKAQGDNRIVLVSDPYHNERLLGTAEELGLSAGVSSTGAEASLRQLAGETAAVALGRLIGYRRLLRLG
ncbi:MAG: YdcF family protein [Candidatus Microthrix subdominans]|uniref:YdcF family protein n=1 Tax=Candidatus Neomicrothrix subdominans TaxID=2954438 RepID=A0A936NBA5_9ACTN|nr:YdcF family protein [Candidatus Microthrix sp.]MBK9296288.1 YdcF family protein [Candidatus Microthrix subdominans]MBK6439325.1 YdcF family protein [Candidatus Microthrix sp.]MBK6967706.1 YdcF family protein [Candidatus Microthrix sp.]MBK7164679.1 YdcF family protein [Candidatus Microthrix sp.]MBP7595245.1 YdcF family protein [Candidatus Microthrix sp.]